MLKKYGILMLICFTLVFSVASAFAQRTLSESDQEEMQYLATRTHQGILFSQTAMSAVVQQASYTPAQLHEKVVTDISAIQQYFPENNSRVLKNHYIQQSNEVLGETVQVMINIYRSLDEAKNNKITGEEFAARVNHYRAVLEDLKQETASRNSQLKQYLNGEIN